MKAFTSFGDLTSLLFVNGARMPSTADDVCADRRSAALRLAGDLRCGFERESAMREILRQNPTEGEQQSQCSDHWHRRRSVYPDLNLELFVRPCCNGRYRQLANIERRRTSRSIEFLFDSVHALKVLAFSGPRTPARSPRRYWSTHRALSFALGSIRAASCRRASSRRSGLSDN